MEKATKHQHHQSSILVLKSTNGNDSRVIKLFPTLHPLQKWPGLCTLKEWYRHEHLPATTRWLNYTGIMACRETASASMASLQFCVCWHNSSAILIKAGLEKGTVPAAGICTSSNIYIAVVALAYWYHAMQTVPETSTWSHTRISAIHTQRIAVCVSV